MIKEAEWNDELKKALEICTKKVKGKRYRVKIRGVPFEINFSYLRSSDETHDIYLYDGQNSMITFISKYQEIEYIDLHPIHSILDYTTLYIKRWENERVL